MWIDGLTYVVKMRGHEGRGGGMEAETGLTARLGLKAYAQHVLRLHHYPDATEGERRRKACHVRVQRFGEFWFPTTASNITNNTRIPEY